MKKIALLKFNFYLVFVLVLTQEMNAQSFENLDKDPMDIAYLRKSRNMTPLVKVIYGRPQKTEQSVFGNTVAYGKLWRTGANEATEVKFYQDIIFGDVKVPAGEYVLYTIPGEKEWEVILSSNLDVLGAFQYDPVFDVARIKVPVARAEELKVFSIAFKEKEDRSQLVLGWDTIRVNIPLQFEHKEQYARL